MQVLSDVIVAKPIKDPPTGVAKYPPKSAFITFRVERKPLQKIAFNGLLPGFCNILPNGPRPWPSKHEVLTQY